MADDILVEVENCSKRSARPSLTQLRAIIDFMEKHPELANKKLRNGMTQKKVRKLWTQLTNNANSMDGASKSMEGWMKFWADKTRSIKLKQKQIEEDSLSDTLTPLEQRVLDLSCDEKTTSKRKKGVKQEPCNGNDDDSMDDNMFHNEDMDFSRNDTNNRLSETDEQQINLMEKLVEVMNQQATAMSQIAQSSLNNALALQRLADASHMQALAVERLANSFGTINGSVNDVRNAIVSIDYTMKRCYSASTTQHRQNSNLFS